MLRHRVWIAGVARENHASQIPSTFLRDGEGIRRVGDGGAKRDSSSGAPRTSYIAERERISEARGPLTAQVLEWFKAGLKERRPWEGLRPYTEQKDAGIRMLPPPSPPRAMGTRPALTAYAQPLEEPPV